MVRRYRRMWSSTGDLATGSIWPGMVTRSLLCSAAERSAGNRQISIEPRHCTPNTSRAKLLNPSPTRHETQEVVDMALTRDFKKTVLARVERDPAFAKALLDEAATLFLSDEPETARVILRDLVNATLGFEQLAKMTATPSKSLHRMLSPKGNPSMDNLAAIFGAIGSRLKVGLRVHTVRATS